VRNILDLLVDGDIVKEALLVNFAEGEQIIYQGSRFSKILHDIISILIRNLHAFEYCILQLSPTEKYIVIKLSPQSYVAMRVAPKVDGERYVSKIKSIINNLENLFLRK